MKKLFAVFFVCLFLQFGAARPVSVLYKNLTPNSVKKVLLYSHNLEEKTDFNKNGCNFMLNNGINNVYQASFKDLMQYEKEFDFSGIELFVACIDINSFLINMCAKVVKTEKICGRTIIYAHSYKLQKCIAINGTKINLQICVYNNEAVIGYPVLLGSY